MPFTEYDHIECPACGAAIARARGAPAIVVSEPDDPPAARCTLERDVGAMRAALDRYHPHYYVDGRLRPEIWSAVRTLWLSDAR